MSIWAVVFLPPMQKKGMKMFINKIGWEHKESGRNCQDFGFEQPFESIVCDGCSEGEHSEVGAKLFCYLMQDGICPYYTAFETMLEIFGNDYKALKNYLCFTIIDLTKEREKFWDLNYCGDGFVILQDHDGNITFEELSDGEFPKYYVYNYIDEQYLKHYKNGVSFLHKEYFKEQYQKVGIASDGLRYILQADEDLKKEFIECLKSGKELKTKLFINRNHHIFKDDITIVF